MSAYIYRDQLQENVLTKQYYLEVDMADLIGYNDKLADGLKKNPAEFLPLVRDQTDMNHKRLTMCKNSLKMLLKNLPSVFYL